MSVANLKGTVSRIARGQVDRLGGNLGINSLMLTVTYDGVSRPLLNPWSCSLDVGLAWEPWLMKEASPQVKSMSYCYWLILLELNFSVFHWTSQ